ncbi:lamin tail domain-containing protein [Halorubrum rubrum]|uniref:Lamin tail domain-containing protein n=1 Tax=Halorubrum rubrum TaxID=1126240 RepID=A0ABD5R327_9EURY|nr:lamin tail domain-containing protein [Halorubrum rubrum]
MNRRTFLATSCVGLAVGIAGCQTLLNRSDDSEQPETTPTDNRAEDTTNGLRIVGVYADDIDREFLDGEYLLMKNTSTDPLDVSGYVVEYPTGYSHQIADLVLEPGAQFALMSRDGEDSVFQMSPPLHLRYLAADTAPLLGKRGTVRVRDTENELVATVSYENFGCDGETETGDETACLHSISSES